MKAGNINVKPLSADLTHNTEFLLKMNPYVIFNFANSEKRTGTSSRKGKNPIWADSLNFYVNGETTMQVKVKDKDLIRDDLVVSIPGVIAGKTLKNYSPSRTQFTTNADAIRTAVAARMAYYDSLDIFDGAEGLLGALEAQVKKWGGGEFRPYQTQADVFLALSQGQLDATVSTSTVAQANVKSGNFPGIAVVGKAPFDIDYVALFTNREEAGLINYLNLFINHQVRSGRYAELYGKWVGGEAPSLTVPGVYR